MDKYPISRFIVSPQTEANRVLHTMVQTANGFYFTHKFAVLPYLEAKNPSSVHLPKLDFSQNDLWTNLKEIHDVIPLNYPESQSQAVEKLLSPISSEVSQTAGRFKEEWGKVEARFWKFINEVMPAYVNNIEDIEVRVTQYGSKVSFERVSATQKNDFIATSVRI